MRSEYLLITTCILLLSCVESKLLKRTHDDAVKLRDQVAAHLSEYLEVHVPRVIKPFANFFHPSNIPSFLTKIFTGQQMPRG